MRGLRPPRLSLDVTKPLRLLALLFIAVAAVGFAAFTLLVALPFIIRGFLSLLGIGAPATLLGTGALLWQGRRLGQRGLLRAHWRHVGGSILILAGSLGLASLARPEGLSFLGVSWSEASLGGLLGQLILGAPGEGRALRTVPLLAAGIAIAFPQTIPWTGRRLLVVVAFIASLRLPQRAWGLAWGLMRQSAGRIHATLRRGRSGTAVDQPTAPADLSGAALPLEGYGEPMTLEDWEALAVTPPIQGTLLPLMASEEEREPLPSQPFEEELAPGAERGLGTEDQISASLPIWNRWEMPALNLLEPTQEADPGDQTQRARQIEEALASYGVEARVSQIHVGPAVTQFGVEPGWDHKYREVKERDSGGHIKLDKDGNTKVRIEETSRTRVKVERITALSNNLALALAAPSVRIEAPVPGKQVVGIEVPNITPGLVSLRSVIESPAFQRLRTRSKLALALGKGVAGDVAVADLAKMPHLLIAGATGSGKSVCINSIVSCLLMHASPDEVRFLMIDPKRVELVPYNAAPHLLGPVLVDPEKVVGTLHWVLKEMEERYRKFAAAGVRNIDGYNRSPKITDHLPFWVLIIDELADLMMVAPYEVERGICRLAQLARATGIHLVVATQRPSVDVVTGLIKANFPTRISFAVTSHIDSRTILDSSGAEKLLGRGDMLYMATDAAKPKRVQGAYVSDDEVESIVRFWSHDRFRLLRPSQFEEEMQHAAASAASGREDEDDPLLDRARELAETAERISTSFLQRRLRIGYPRAARLMETLQEEGYDDPGLAEERF